MISPPLSLYIHLPWCVRKCPYCDFNSHEIKDGSFPEKEYVDAVIRDLEFTAGQFRGRDIISIFFGGGTPSVMSANGIGSILEAVDAISSLSADTEITLEANPGTTDSRRFAGYRRLGVNRISIGAQSFSDDKLAAIGRIHNGSDAVSAVETAVGAGFSNINIDLMYGLPGQTVEDALSDLVRAVSLEPTHISWYQLTIEPNTVFYSRPPLLPDDDLTWQMQTCGQDYLAQRRYRQYEVSAWSRENHECRHNLNYWQFGDYIGIGAGAHGKITTRTATPMANTASFRRKPESSEKKSPDVIPTEAGIQSVNPPSYRKQTPLDFHPLVRKRHVPVPLLGFRRNDAGGPIFTDVGNKTVARTRADELYP